jgi:hypothetical protein
MTTLNIDAGYASALKAPRFTGAILDRLPAPPRLDIDDPSRTKSHWRPPSIGCGPVAATVR